MTIHGVTMSFPRDTVEGKKINVRSDEEGGLEFNIEGRRPRNYILSRSASTNGTGRREIDDRHLREDTRSDRASRHSSRSGYSGRGLLE